MNTVDKSLELATLMGWDVISIGVENHIRAHKGSGVSYGRLNPYHKQEMGLSQFAAILLKFPEVMYCKTVSGWPNHVRWEFFEKPTQANILDEILRMNGVDL